MGIKSLRDKLAEVFKHSLIYGLGSVTQSAVGLILLPILTGELSRTDFGVYSLIFMATTIFGSIFYLGMTSALPRSFFDYKNNIDRQAVFSTAFLILLFGVFFQCLIGILFNKKISLILTGQPIYFEAVAWALAGGALGFLNNFFFSYLRLLRKSISSVIFSLLFLTTSIGFTIILLRINPGSVSAPFKAVFYAHLLIILIFFIIFGRKAFVLKLKYNEISKLLHFGIASVFAGLGHMLIEWSDRLIIAKFLSIEDVGSYSASVKVGMLLNVVLVLPFVQIWTPMIMEYRKSHDIKELFRSVFSFFIIIGGSIILIASIFATEILSFLIKSGVNNEMVIVFLFTLITTLLYGTTNFFVAGLHFERKVYQLSIVYYGVAVFKVLMALFLVPLIGLVGAALSSFVSYLLVAIGINLLAKRHFSFTIEWPRLAVFLIIAAPGLLYGCWGYNVLELDFGIKILFIIVLLSLTFLFCFSKQEKLLAWKVVKSEKI